MHADAAATTLLASAAQPPVLAEAAAATLFAVALPPVLTDAAPATLLAHVALQPVLAQLLLRLSLWRRGHKDQWRLHCLPRSQICWASSSACGCARCIFIFQSVGPSFNPRAQCDCTERLTEHSDSPFCRFLELKSKLNLTLNLQPAVAPYRHRCGRPRWDHRLVDRLGACVDHLSSSD